MTSKRALGAAAVALVSAVLGAALITAPAPPRPRTYVSASIPAAAGRTQLIEQRIRDPKGEPSDWMRDQRAAGDGPVTAAAVRRAFSQARAVARTTARIAPEVAKAQWEHLGPTNFGGRVADVAVDPDGGTVYAGTASGGVWKSTDSGTTFTYAWSARLPQAIGAIAVAADGTIFAGTGEASPGGGSVTFGGTGIYRSSDGGDTWKRVGLETSGAFGRIAVDPENPKRVFAAAAGDLFVPGGERGLYRSTNGGNSWTRVLAGQNATTGAVDVAIDPSDPDHLLVAMWDHKRLPTHRFYGGPGSGLYSSADGGNSWRPVRDVVGRSDADTGRIGVAFAPSDPQRAYAMVVDISGDPVALYRSNDGGKSWQTTAAAPATLQQSTFGWWFGRIFVDPKNADRVFVAGVELIESLDGGNTFLPQSQTLVGVGTGAFQASVALHADQHAIVWDPQVPTRVYLGNDGGMYRSVSDGRATTWAAAARQGWTQHYSVDVSDQNPARVVSGLQDNMCQRNYLVAGAGAPGTWTKYGLCGDGLQTLISFENDNVVYGCAQYGANCSRTVDGGGAFVFLGDTVSQRHGWWVPMVFDPNDADIMYTGGNIVNRSTDAGDSWSAISPDLTTNPEQLDPSPGYRIYGTITTIAVAKSDPSVLYVGTDDGLLWTTKDLGKKWLRLKDDDLPRLWITRVVVDPSDADVAYASYSGFRAGDDTPHVVVTRDGGKTWSNLSGNLPSAPVNDIVLTGKGLAVGTDVGVYLTTDQGDRWLRVGSNLPMVPILDLRYHEASNTLTAATFGHGIQRVTL